MSTSENKSKMSSSLISGKYNALIDHYTSSYSGSSNTQVFDSSWMIIECGFYI